MTMTALFMTIAAIILIALLYVVAPIAADAFARFRGKHTVRCPETGLTAEVEIDARHAALTAVPGPAEVRVAACSLWPEREGCAQQCLDEAGFRS